MVKWPKVKLADCVNLLAGFPFKSQQFTNKPDDVPLVKGENVSQGCILWDISKRWLSQASTIVYSTPAWDPRLP